MMKQKYFALFMACVMAVALTGCSAGRENNSTAPVNPTNSMTSDYDSRPSANSDSGAGSSAGLNDGVYPTNNVGGGNAANDDQGIVSGTPSDNVIDDIGDAVSDAVQGAGDAMGNGSNNVGGTMR